MSTSARPTGPTFLQFLADAEDGRLATSLSDEMREIVTKLRQLAVTNGGKQKAKLVIAIDFELQQGIVDVTASVKTVTPKPIRGKSVFYPTKDNGLSLQNTRQQELDFKDVSAGERRDVRSIALT